MAYVKDKSTILQKMREINAVCYTISGIGGKPIHSQNDDMDMPLDRAIDLMQNDLDSFEGTVEVTLREVSKSKRNQGGITRSNHVYLIRLGSSESRSGGDSNNIFSLMMQLNAAKIEAIDAKYRHMEEIRQLKEKKKNDSAMDKYMPMLVPYFPHILQKMGIPVPVHGFPELAAPQEVTTETEFMANNTLTPQDIARINAAVARLQKLDPDFINNLEALANYAEKNIEQYNLVLPMIRGAS